MAADFYAIILSIQLALQTGRLIVGLPPPQPPPTDTLLTWAGLTAVNAASVGQLVSLQWRRRRYLRREPAGTIGSRP